MPYKPNKKEALDYHVQGRPGKIEVISTKPTNTQRDLALAYSPGVAEPCIKIAERRTDVYKYTAKGNLVGVISNGTAVLGLGDIGPEAAKPVMEGKAVLFKVFADIDCFDIEVAETDVDKFVQVVKALEPTFGGINLEDIKSPECFEIEKRLKKAMKIPVMHDDQHGTSIIVGAALLNALQLIQKDINSIKVVMSGAGASAVSCARLICSLGVNKQNLYMVDRDGVVTTDRLGLDKIKKEFARDTPVKTLAGAMEGADLFIGLSAGGIVSPEMLKSMANNPLVFALANPDPEIDYNLAMATRDDIIMATGRSDFPNQVNNVLGFPFIFRGALDVRSRQINEEMKLAAVHALADLARKPVPEIVNLAYNEKNIAFGRNYIIPKPLDPRLITTVAPAVAKAAVESKVARKKLKNWDKYEAELRARLGQDNKLISIITNKAKKDPKRVVFAEADSLKILKAAQIVYSEHVAYPILLGNEKKITSLIKEYELGLENCPIIDPLKEDFKREEYGDILYQKRKRRGYTFVEACKAMRSRNYYGMAMLETGEADAFISGLTRNYPDTIRPALQIIGRQDGIRKVAGMYVIFTKHGTLFFADTTVNVDPDIETLTDITELVYNQVKLFNIEPRVAMLSYSNFGSSEGESPLKVMKAVEALKQKYPSMIIDGEVQANFAVNGELMKEYFPFSELSGKGANVLIFPNLSSGNIAYKLLLELGIADAVGPVLLGLKKSVQILQLGSSVREIVNMVALAVLDAQNKNTT